MEKQVLQLYKALIALPTIWPGWDHTKTPIAFYDDEKAMLLSHPNPPKEYEVVIDDGITYYVCQPKPKHFTANTSMPVNGVQTATIRYYDGEFNALLGLTVHEAFHAYQANNHFPVGNMSIHYPSFDALVNALGEVEAKSLHLAIATKDIEYVKQACDARASRQVLLVEIEKERLSKLSDSEKEDANRLLEMMKKETSDYNMTIASNLIELEDFNEIHEGLAVYTEMKALDHTTNRWNEHLNELLTINENGKGASRQRFYTSGMAYGLLLDEYETGWQQIFINNWQSLASVLTHAINHTVDPNRREFLDVDFNAIYTKQQNDMQQKVDTLQNLVNEAFPKQGIHVEVKLKGNVVSGGWNPHTVQSLPDGSRLHTTMLLYHYDNQSEIYVAKGAIEKSMCLHFIFECHDATITVDKQVIKEGEQTGTVAITSDDWKLRIPKALIQFDGKNAIDRRISRLVGYLL